MGSVTPHERAYAWLRDGRLVLPLGLIGGLVLVAMIIPVFWLHDPTSTNFADAGLPPSPSHLMGTDGVGRDVFARFAEGAGISMTIGLIAVVTGSLVGSSIGVVAALAGRAVDEVLMRIMDALMAFPSLMIAVAVTIALGPGIAPATVGVVLGMIPWFARIARSEALRVRSLPHVEAAVTLGASGGRIFWRHLLPHMAPILLVQATASYGAAILSIAALGFLGLGAQIPTPEWGAMITEGLLPALTGQWWGAFFPGAGILVLVSAVNILSDRLRDVLDPRGAIVPGRKVKR